MCNKITKIMNNYSNAIGIDVSKHTLDAVDYKMNIHHIFDNSASGFKKMMLWAKKNNGNNLDRIIFCFEHTGIYSFSLAFFLNDRKVPFTIVPGLEIKRSLGMIRGKNDKIDACQIARYAYLRREEIREYQLPSKEILKLKSLLSLRDKLVKHRVSYQGHLKELKTILKKNDNPLLIKVQEKVIKELSGQIKNIENEILRIINQNDQLKEIYQLVTSVKGVGLVLGAHFLVYTNCFTAFGNWRQFASYSGIAPFEDKSGISRKHPKRVSHMANKRIKALLSNAASTCIQYSPEMKIYYQRRLKEGKSKMSTQNIIRNKIVARVFAVVNRKTPYVDLVKFAS